MSIVPALLGRFLLSIATIYCYYVILSTHSGVLPTWSHRPEWNVGEEAVLARVQKEKAQTSALRSQAHHKPQNSIGWNLRSYCTHWMSFALARTNSRWWFESDCAKNYDVLHSHGTRCKVNHNYRMTRKKRKKSHIKKEKRTFIYKTIVTMVHLTPTASCQQEPTWDTKPSIDTMKTRLRKKKKIVKSVDCHKLMCKFAGSKANNINTKIRNTKCANCFPYWCWQ